MELGIIAIIAYAGMRISRNNDMNRDAIEQNVTETDRDIITNSFDDITDQTYDQFVSNNMIPYYSSERSQNTNDNFKDTILSTFTGVDNLDYQSKKDASENFKPIKDLTNISGKQNTLDYELSHYNTTNIHNNVLPFQQEMVGRGLGISSDVSAKGGFHDSFRILPENINAYKKCSYDNRIVSGKSQIDYRTSDINFTKEVEDNIIHREVYPTIVKRYAKPTTESQDGYILRENNRDNENCSMGILTGDNGHTLGQQNTYTNDKTVCINPSNLSGNDRGAYANAKYLIHDQQQLCTPNTLNVVGTPGNYTTPSDNVKMTMRGNNKNCENTGFIGSRHIQNPNYNSYDNVKNTQRDNCTEFHGFIQNGTGQHVNPYYANSTQRGSSCNELHGPASSYRPKGSLYNPMYENTEQHMKRELVSTGFTPGAERMNMPLNANEVINNVNLLKSDFNDNSYTSISHVRGYQNHNNLNNMGGVMIPERLPEANTRIDFEVAKE